MSLPEKIKRAIFEYAALEKCLVEIYDKGGEITAPTVTEPVTGGAVWMEIPRELVEKEIEKRAELLQFYFCKSENDKIIF